jgi:hypothetical protein
MAIKINIPDMGEVTVEGAAEESTMQEILAAIQKSDKTKRKEENVKAAEEKKEADAKKKNTKAVDDTTSALDKFIKKAKEEQEKYKGMSGNMDRFKTALGATGKGLTDVVKNISVTATSVFASLITTYDQMASDPIQAGKGMLQTAINLTRSMLDITIDVGVAVGKALVGWIPFVGAGMAQIVDAFGTLAHRVVGLANDIVTAANEVLAKEFQKRADLFSALSGIQASFTDGMSTMSDLAGQSGVGIKNFSDAVVAARPMITAMGVDAGTATKLLAKGFAALTKTGVRDELYNLGYAYNQQGKIMAQYMAQQKAAGTNLTALANNQEFLSQGTLTYAKHLKVVSDITGQDAVALMDQARAEAQRGALMNSLTASQAKAFQDAYATMAAVPGQQGPKLQAALAQMLAGGVVTDPVIAGNQIIMDMLRKTAGQVSSANTDMVVATQRNLGVAATAYRAAGDSATDFATLMNPSGTSAVAQGMSTFGNALRQYRYDPNVAATAMDAADAQAAAGNAYVGLVSAMTAFQVKMEGIAGDALPAYTAAMLSATETTFKIVNLGLDFITGKLGVVDMITKAMGGTIDTSGADAANKAKSDSLLPGLGALITAADPAMSEKAAGTSDALANAQKSATQTTSPGDLGTASTAYTPPPPPAATPVATAPTMAVPTLADGGVASGPLSGYSATLHGSEAVVPLPDGKSIPISIENTAPNTKQNTDNMMLTAAINQQTGLLHQILSSMQKNNSLTSGILQASL